MIFCYRHGENIKEIDDEYIPKVGDHISLDGQKELIVTLLFNDYSTRKLYVKVRPVKSSDVTYLVN